MINNDSNTPECQGILNLLFSQSDILSKSFLIQTLKKNPWLFWEKLIRKHATKYFTETVNADADESNSSHS